EVRKGREAGEERREVTQEGRQGQGEKQGQEEGEEEVACTYCLGQRIRDAAGPTLVNAASFQRPGAQQVAGFRAPSSFGRSTPRVAARLASDRSPDVPRSLEESLRDPHGMPLPARGRTPHARQASSGRTV